MLMSTILAKQYAHSLPARKDNSMYSTMTRKGQVTIPAALRHSYGFREGAMVEFFPSGTFVGVRPVATTQPGAKSGFGLVKSKRKHAPADFDVARLLAKKA